jgi:hypothetical protein
VISSNIHRISDFNETASDMDEVLVIEFGRVRFMGVSTSFFIKIA